MVYALTLSESQRVMLWQLIIEDLRTNIQHIAGVDNIVSYTLSKLPSTSVDKYNPSTIKTRCRANELFKICGK